MKINELMTQAPHTINAEQNLKYAQEKMRELNVRHLPVLDGGQLVGVLSERDIQFIESFESLDAEEIKVDDAFSNEVYAVESNTEVRQVCSDMAERKLGSALVLENKKLVGIFTWIDALRYLGQNA